MKNCIPLTPHSPGVREELIQPTSYSGWGKLITSKDLVGLSGAKKLMIVQHGLPGVEWRIQREKEAQVLVKEQKDVAVVMGVAQGMKLDARLLNLSSPEDLGEISAQGGSLTKPFTLKDYLEGPPRMTRALRARYAQNAELILVGHSYGAMVMLHAWKSLLRNGRQKREDTLLQLLAPFIKAELMSGDPELDLSIINTRIAALDDDLSPEAQRQKLRTVLEECRDYYHVDNGGDLEQMHKEAFGIWFYKNMQHLHRPDQASTPRVILGSNDPHIGEDHAELISSLTRHPKSDLLRVVEQSEQDPDPHALNSVHLRDLLT